MTNTFIPDDELKEIYKFFNEPDATKAYNNYLLPLINKYGEELVDLWTGLVLRAIIEMR